MLSSALTPGNSTIVMIDHAVGFGNVFRSHDVSLHVNNAVGLAKTAGVFGIPLVLTNGADTGPYGPLFSELRAVIGDAPVIVREGNFINAFQTPRFAAAVETARGFMGLMAQHSPAFGMLLQGAAAQPAPRPGAQPAPPPGAQPVAAREP